jgi:hypothetical protein
MKKYMYEYHEYSYWPHWYVAYSDFNKTTEHLLKQKKDLMKKWIKENKIDSKIDKKGNCYRFGRQSDLTMFLLRWAS